MSEHSVLIIDDDEDLVSALKEGLETLGFKVATAYDGLQGVMQAHQGKPDIIMLDFNMPAGGGSGVYERLRSSADMARTPIVFLTGATVEEVKKTIRSTPNTFFLKKPLSVTQLRKVLDKILAANKAAAGGIPAPITQTPPAPAPAPAPVSTAQLPGTAKTSPFSGMGTPAESNLSTTPLDKPLGRTHEDSLPPAPAPAVEVPPAPAPAPAAAPVSAAPSGRLHGQVYEFNLRVSYADSDRLGIVYYANYLKFFEIGRAELMRSLGIRYRDLEIQRQLFIPPVESRCEYIAPCRYDDLIRVRTWLSWMGPASLCFQNEVLNIEEGSRLCVRGFTRHALLNAYWKPERIPADLKQAFSAYVVQK